MVDEISVQKNNEDHISICDIMKGNTSEIIRKHESQIPLMLENYSNLYSEFLRIFDSIYGTCYINEKEFFDKLNIDQKLLKQLKDNSEYIKNQYLENIVIGTQFFDEQIKMRISAMHSFENFVRILMDSYSKSL
ncbi:Hypothetical protein Nlim_1739 [Candidatus Nitrosarchaeum limnium SFB1]|jgi:hypothetical protein|uniref:Uncharacterized protein n=1 Tax=Candidatus Nitrosarchaeum limnium SFB1 TaxID=886738 RepID=F3KMI9_9ARCH|nr:Hypothetical protein Nlim_1739 [Candidatus Nitrosarchaeum limnium SFB1]